MTLRVRIGLSDIDTHIDIEYEDADSFIEDLEQALQDGLHFRWYTDPKGNRVGVPIHKIAFVTLETQDEELTVGFG